MLAIVESNNGNDGTLAGAGGPSSSFRGTPCSTVSTSSRQADTR